MPSHLGEQPPPPCPRELQTLMLTQEVQRCRPLADQQSSSSQLTVFYQPALPLFSKELSLILGASGPTRVFHCLCKQ